MYVKIYTVFMLICNWSKFHDFFNAPERLNEFQKIKDRKFVLINPKITKTKKDAYDNQFDCFGLSSVKYLKKY